MRRILQKFLVVVAAAMWIGTAVAQTSGVEGGVKWSVSNGVLTISAASATECEEGYQPGYMKDYINPSSGSCGARAWQSTGATSLVVEEGVKKVGTGAFYDLLTLQSATLPTGVEEWARAAFWMYSSGSQLSSVTLPEDMEIIPNDFFNGCTSLKTIELPSGLKNIGYNAFKQSGLTSIELPEGFEELADTDGNGYAFQKCESLKSISLPSTLKVIADYTFYGCKSLERVDIPSGVTKIGKGAFNGCTNVEIYMPYLSTFDGEVGAGMYGATAYWIDSEAFKDGVKKLYVPNVISENISDYPWSSSVTGKVEAYYYAIETETGGAYEVSVDQIEGALYDEGHQATILPKSLAGNKISFTVSGSGEYDVSLRSKATVTLTAEPAGEAGGDKCSFTMPEADVTIVVKQRPRIMITTPENGSVKVMKVEQNGETEVESASVGDAMRIDVQPEEGYQVKSVTVSYYDASIQDANYAEVGEGYTFTMPEADEVNVTVEFEERAQKVSVTCTVGGTVTVSDGHPKAGDEISITYETEEGYKFVKLLVNDKEFTDVWYTVPNGDVNIVGVFKPITKEVRETQNQQGAPVVVVGTSAGLTEVFDVMTDENDYYASADVLLSESIDYGENNIDIENLTAENIDKIVEELPTVEELVSTFDGQGNTINNMVAQVSGMFGGIDAMGALMNLMMNNSLFYIDPTQPIWTESNDTIYVHLVAKENNGLIQNFGFAGRIVIDESLIPIGKTVVVCLVEENKSTGTMSGFFFDQSLIDGLTGNKRCITIKQNIGCAKNSGKVKVATCTDGSNKGFSWKSETDEAELNKMEREFTVEQFASGEVAYWLNWSGRGYTGEYKATWRQGEHYPELALDMDGVSNGLYKVDYDVNDETKIVSAPEFANNMDKVTIAYSEKPVSIMVGGESVEVGEESTTITFDATKKVSVVFKSLSGIRDVLSEGGDADVYDLSGRHLGKTTSKLAKGMYVVVKGGKSERVVVK